MINMLLKEKRVNMLNIVIPMAGRGSRFAKAGYVNPKPLIDIYGHAMIEYVTKNICEIWQMKRTASMRNPAIIIIARFFAILPL